MLGAAVTSDSAPCPCQRRPCARYKLLPPCFRDTAGRARKQKNGPEDRFNALISFRKSDRARGFESSTPPWQGSAATRCDLSIFATQFPLQISTPVVRTGLPRIAGCRFIWQWTNCNVRKLIGKNSSGWMISPRPVASAGGSRLEASFRDGAFQSEEVVR